MPQYAYKAVDSRGSIISGKRMANDELELVVLLRRTGLELLKARPVSSVRLFAFLDDVQIGGVSRIELIEFSNNMGVMLKGGVPLVEALSELREDQGNRFFKNVLDSVVEQIEGGKSLNEALKRYPKVFPGVFANIVEIGENSGRLDNVFFDLAKHFKRIDDLAKNARKAMIYPAAVLLILIMVSMFFLIKVFPTMFNLLSAFNVTELPPLTRAFLAISTFLEKNLLWVFLGAIAFVVLVVLLRKNKITRYYFDWLELRVPYIQGFFLQLRMATFARYLSMLQAAGVQIIPSMELATQAVHNLVIERLLKHSLQKITEGNTLSSTLRGGSLIPHMVVRMISVGESSGTLPEQLEFVANYYDEGLERKISVALAIMEPLLILVLAGMTLSLIVALFEPMYGIFTDVFKMYGGSQ